MADFGFLGPRGGGKTTGAVYFGRMQQLAGWKIRANFKMVDAKPLEVLDLIDIYTERAYELLLPDEIYGLVESRVSSKKINLFMSYVNFQARKMHRHIVYTAQLVSSVDLRFVELTDLPIACKNRFGEEEDADFDYLMMLDDDEIPFTLPYYWAKEHLFDLFNTDEVVPPWGIEDMIAELQKQKPDVLNHRVDSITEFLMQKYDWIYNDRSLVEDRMLQHSLPLGLARFVHNRIKTKVRMAYYQQQQGRNTAS